MSNRIDHAAESHRVSEAVDEYIQESISDEGWTDNIALLAAVEAMRQSVLALVEQQRIATLAHLATEGLTALLTTDVWAALGIQVPSPEPRSDRDRAWDGAADGGRLG